MAIHWCGAGQNAWPGLRRLLAGAPADVHVWVRAPDRVAARLGARNADIHAYDPDQLGAEVSACDVVVSMLPPDGHLTLATIAANKGAHFVCPGAFTPELQALHAKSLLAHVSLVVEAGLSPGIDHLLARQLFDAYRKDPACDPANDLHVFSAAGVVPAGTASFRAGLGAQAETLQRALSIPARGVRKFQDWRVNLPWDEAWKLTLDLDGAQPFEALPRGDAVPLLDLYGCDPTWRIANLERALLRPEGWTAAWGPVLAQLDSLNQVTPSALETAMTATGGERAIVCVALDATRDGTPVWSRMAMIEAVDDTRGTALSRMVSLHVALVAEHLAFGGDMDAGVQCTNADPATAARWLAILAKDARYASL